ncbi:MAG: PAS domain-containing sensor histidine kinase [Comamonadaceae bacterium CG1_02_60_18]|nr:MAG: PAS domain-containing sensor histidine kinase [Comamonadaceae bacterium CG1_02_60_18]PIQ51658.1 MAG: PAS domain-containing sensor histidine kinase [Comamonadaceae bacterium CG12_big_fil_rev_8_21_14_0_65_59_15]
MTAQPPKSGSSAGEQPLEFERLWRGFMTARATLGLVLVTLQGSIYLLAAQPSGAPLTLCLAYAAATLTLRVTDHPRQLGQTIDGLWLRTVGLDVLTFSVLQLVQGSSINYSALLALPVLMVSILGTALQAMASAAGVTLLLFGYAGWLSVQSGNDFTPYLLQAALTGAGCFAISFIASQMATRLASVELRAKRSQLAVAVQQQVNQLVIESLTEGIMVVTPAGQVHLANPAAKALLQAPGHDHLMLGAQPGWQGLMDLINASFASQQPQQAQVEIRHHAHPLRRLLVRTQLTRSQDSDTLGLCVLFLLDQREFEARIRTEKLAGMGRMSAAVAHEIRNPLAAITQANALLAEDLKDPGQQRLAHMVQQNANRLEAIVKDVLHLAQVPGNTEPAQPINLNEAIDRIGRDWNIQNERANLLAIDPQSANVSVVFDTEHLRRVLTNLADNALRYASGQPGSIQIGVQTSDRPSQPGEAQLSVWSDGAALEPSVEQHLFEPFFSSESRSSGLGLYICRELCESHGASITYERTQRRVMNQWVPGNEFRITFRQTMGVEPTA